VAVALIAGADAELALRLGFAMVLLQFSIAAANDYADAPLDAIVKPGKPVPSGLLSRRSASRVAGILGGVGLAAAATVSVGTLAIGLIGLGVGLAYDLRLKSTPLSFLPLAVGVGLLPVYSWLGARGAIPSVFVGVVCVAVLAGVTLALANSYVDIEKDRRSGIASAATYLGTGRTLFFGAAVLAVVQLVAGATTAMLAGQSPQLLAIGCGLGLGWIGLGLAAAPGYRTSPLVWELQALGIVILGAAWLAALNSAGLLRT
jgi:4-hydroxybenzoate polyprenyltransferase